MRLLKQPGEAMAICVGQVFGESFGQDFGQAEQQKQQLSPKQ